MHVLVALLRKKFRAPPTPPIQTPTSTYTMKHLILVDILLSIKK